MIRFRHPLFSVALIAAAIFRAHAAEPGPLASVLQAAVDKHEAAGTVVLAADKERVLDLEAAGFSSLSAKAPMKTDALFWIASMTKSFTGAALMMLVDEGKVNLDDPVEKYLPEFKGQMVAEDGIEMHPPRHPITVREVMDHTSGVATPQDPAFKGKNTLKEIVEVVGKLPLHREPGTKYEYNNSGINTGGRIIEVVSGMSYVDFMQQRLFTPLEMKDTTFFPNEEQGSRMAHSARFTEDKKDLEDINNAKGITPQLIAKLSEGQDLKVSQVLIENMGMGVITEAAHRYGQPAGGLYSTASDVGRFCQMLLNGGTWHGHRYLSEAAVKTLATSQTGDVVVNPNEGYGVGFSVKLKDDEGPAPGSFGHRGARRTVMWVDPTHQLVMVALLQRMDMSGEQQKDFYGSVFRAMVEKFGKKGN
jgi:CubicO group peptidase (beta-lactamase class C family)